jgi:diguanylate cyclase (GGDEF)-like protein
MGDDVLRHIADVLRDSARAHDTISRLGGEEFLVVCPDTASAGAQACAERLRSAVERATFTVQKMTLSVTVSIGVAVWNKFVPTIDVLIKAADRALYSAKDAGRNRTCVFEAAVPNAAQREPAPH